MRKHGRRDANHTDIVGTFRACGCSVLDCADLGDGKPDLVVATASACFVVEVKDGTKPPSARKLTTKEQQFKDNWKGLYFVIESVDDVIKLLRDI